MKNTKKRKPVFKVSTAIIVAIIGCLGTFVTAIFGYLAMKSQVEIPIKATQTSEALKEYLTKNAPTETDIPLAAVVFTETPSVDWNSIIKVSSSLSSPCGIKVAPDSVALDPSNMQLSLKNFNDSFSVNFGSNWDNAIETGLIFELESYSQLNWVKIENRFSINVFVDSQVPDNLNIISISGCGGGFNRDLGRVALTNQNNLREYSISLNSPDVDFFTLQPGEFEDFFVYLECKAPGVYSFTITINLEYTNQAGKITIAPSTKMLCPYRFNKFTSHGGDLLYEGKVEWNGNEYKATP
jgi:hypothetical protein